MKNRLVWCEIPVTDMDRAKEFYAAILQAPLKDNNEGPNPMADLPSEDPQAAAGHLYPGKPAPAGTGNTVMRAARCRSGAPG